MWLRTMDFAIHRWEPLVANSLIDTPVGIFFFYGALIFPTVASDVAASHLKLLSFVFNYLDLTYGLFSIFSLSSHFLWVAVLTLFSSHVISLLAMFLSQ